MALSFCIIAAGIKPHGAVRIAACGSIGAGEIFHRISHIGVGIEKALRIAGITHGTRRSHSDLHYAVITIVDSEWIIAALPLYNAMNEFMGESV